MKIESIAPDDPAYQDLNEPFARLRYQKFNYVFFAKRYNAALVGSILLTEFPNNARVYNVERTIMKWGLHRGIDFDVRKMDEDAEGNELPGGNQILAIKKLTSTKMQQD